MSDPTQGRNITQPRPRAASTFAALFIVPLAPSRRARMRAAVTKAPATATSHMAQ